MWSENQSTNARVEKELQQTEEKKNLHKDRVTKF